MAAGHCMALRKSAGVMYLLFSILLHAARRAMAAAPLLPKRQRYCFTYILILSQTGITAHSRALDLLSPITTARKRSKKTNQKKSSKKQSIPVGLAQQNSISGVLSVAARNLLTSIAQGTMLYAAELTWRGQNSVEDKYQRAINRMRRSALGAFSSTHPRGGERPNAIWGTAEPPSG